MTTTADPFGQADEAQAEIDPFGEDNPEDAGGQGGAANKFAFPSIMDLAKGDGHLVILEPYAYNPTANNPFWQEGDPDAKRTREEFTCVLHVLSGAPIEVKERKENADGEWVETGKYIVIGGDENPWPEHWRRVTVAQTVLLGQLKEKFDVKTQEPKGNGRWLGRLRFVAGSRSPKHLKKATTEALAVAYADAEKRGKAQGLGLAPKIMNATADDRAAAMTYWNEIGKDVPTT